MNTWRILPRRSLRAALIVAVLSSGCQSVSSLDSVALARLVPEREAPIVAAVPTIEPEPVAVEIAPEIAVPETARGVEQRASLPTRSLLLQVLAKRAKRIPAAERAEMVDALLAAEKDYGFDPFLILGVIEQESRFKPKARGPHGSLGLMQVRPFVGEVVAKRIGLRWRGAKTLLDPSSNMRIGTAYLYEMMDMYEREELALAAYNMGPYRLRRMLRRGGFPRGVYAGKVYAHRDEFETRYTDTVAAAPR